MESGEVVFHPEASEEYVAAVEWYAQCGEHLGRSFEQEIERAVQLVAVSPERWAKYGASHRRIFVRRFPYILVYLVKRSRIWVVAVVHGRRKPGYWRSRRVPT